MRLLVLLPPFDTDDNGVSDDLRNMVWEEHYLGYGPAGVMLHVSADPNFIRQNDQVLILAPYPREGYVLMYDSDCVRRVGSFENLTDRATSAGQGLGGANTLLSSVGDALCDKARIYLEVNEALRALFPGQIAATMVTWA